jgi:hypothetical protein
MIDYLDDLWQSNNHINSLLVGNIGGIDYEYSNKKMPRIE